MSLISYGKDVKKLDRLVHPADLSLWASIRRGQGTRDLILSLNSRGLTREELMKGAAALLQSIDSFFDELDTLCREQPSILDEGRVFMDSASP